MVPRSSHLRNPSENQDRDRVVLEGVWSGVNKGLSQQCLSLSYDSLSCTAYTRQHNVSCVNKDLELCLSVQSCWLCLSFALQSHTLSWAFLGRSVITLSYMLVISAAPLPSLQLAHLGL